ncbi:MAG: histidine triad nucleotide-binding protein [Desulfoprunum sp.]|nr:histidine triad nucleotide-binding protein [Desulfoprunum sp.]
MTDCLFCKIVAGQIPAQIVYEDDEIMAFRDIAPVAPQHILIIPKKHLTGPSAIGEEDEQLIGRLMRIASQVAAENGIGDAFRLVMSNGAEAGQLVFHLHMHILGGRPLHWPPG